MFGLVEYKGCRGDEKNVSDYVLFVQLFLSNAGFCLNFEFGREKKGKNRGFGIN